MPSDFTEILAQTGITPNEESKDNVLLGQIDGDLYNEVQDDLLEDYGMTMSFQEITDNMEQYGIGFEYNPNYSVADLIYESLQGES